jgi:hypothetical protein
MCDSLQWLVCAARGRLPQQRGKQLHFATPPYSLTVDLYHDTALAYRVAHTYWPEPHARHFAATDVLFAQIAILNLLCANRNELFRIGRGQPFSCDLEPTRLDTLGEALVGGRGAVEWPMPLPPWA